MADVDSEIEAAEKKAKLSSQQFDTRLKNQQADDRSYIAKVIVIAFVVLIAVVVVAAIAGLAYWGDWNKISEPAKFLMTILGSVMLPVVTLVIGYYFGSK